MKLWKIRKLEKCTWCVFIHFCTYSLHSLHSVWQCTINLNQFTVKYSPRNTHGNAYILWRVQEMMLYFTEVKCPSSKKFLFVYTFYRVSQQVSGSKMVCEHSKHRLPKKMYFASKNCFFSLFSLTAKWYWRF